MEREHTIYDDEYSYYETDYENEEMDPPTTYLPSSSNISKLRSNSTDVKNFKVDLRFPGWTVTAKNWIALGTSFGQNTELDKLTIDMNVAAGFVEDQEFDSEENMNKFLRGVCSNRSVRHLTMISLPFFEARSNLLCPMLEENHNLTRLELESCDIGDKEIEVLVRAIIQRRNSSLRGLGKIDLWNNRIGREGCRELARLLGAPASNSLKYLHLSHNPIDDEGAQALASALARNERLECLALDNTNISSNGFEAFAKALHDKSSIKGTIKSNHTLLSLWLDDASLGGPDGMELSGDLRFSLNINESMTAWDRNDAHRGDRNDAHRVKIFYFHLGSNFDIASFSEMKSEVLPQALDWVGRYEYEKNKIRLTAFFHVIRNFPVICSFPSSSKKLRDRLEEETALLREENIQLKQQVERLMLEREEMRSNKRAKP